eukprot:2542868-Pyramimonas_sp.AAC.1
MPGLAAPVVIVVASAWEATWRCQPHQGAWLKQACEVSVWGAEHPFEMGKHLPEVGVRLSGECAYAVGPNGVVAPASSCSIRL